MGVLNSSDIVLKVTPDILNGTSQEVSQKIKTMKQHYEELKDIINRTKAYWIGDAGDMHRKLYTDQQDKIDEIFKRLEEHPRDLLEIAKVYMDTEKKVTDIANELPGDVIV